MENSESHENRFVIIYDVLRLQEMATYQVARSIWHNFISNLDRGVGNNSMFQLHDDEQICNMRKIHFDTCCKILKSLNVPQSIEKSLENELTRILDKVKIWCIILLDIIGKCVWNPHWCVWHPNNEIDQKLSAAKVISNTGELNDEQKFDIMCDFCLEDDIVKFPVDSLPADFIERARTQVCRLTEYWYYFAKNELHMVRRLSNEDEPISLNAEIALDLIDYHWIPFEYFWRRLDAEEQDLVASVKFDRRPANFCDGLEQTLAMMSWQQQRRLLSLRFNEIIFRLITRDRLPTLRWAWTHFKHLINFETFSHIVMTIVAHYQDEEELMSWALDMWNSVPEPFKTRVEGRSLFSLWEMCNGYKYVWPSRSGFKFVCKMLSVMDVDHRRDIILREGMRYGALLIAHDLMNELINICLPNINDQNTFKKSVLESPDLKYVCVKSIHEANLGHIDMVLEFYLDTSNEILEFKKQLLIRSKAIPEQFMYKIGSWNSLCAFIDEIYPGDDALVLKTKKQLIKSCVVNFTGCSGNDANDVARFIEIVESLFTEDDLNTVKRTLLHSFQSMIRTHYDKHWYIRFLNEKYFYRFVKWCVGEFEYDFRALVGAIFDGFFGAPNKFLNGPSMTYDSELFSSLSVLNECLIWYLKTDEEVKKYKLDKITLYRDMVIFQRFMNRDYESKLRIILNWFFDNDESAVQQFESNMSGSG